MSVVFYYLSAAGWEILEAKCGTREKTETSVCFTFVAIFSVAHLFYTCAIYTYPWTEEIEMNQTGPLLVWKQTSKQMVAIYIKCYYKTSWVCCGYKWWVWQVHSLFTCRIEYLAPFVVYSMSPPPFGLSFALLPPSCSPGPIWRWCVRRYLTSKTCDSSASATWEHWGLSMYPWPMINHRDSSMSYFK